MTTNYPTGTDTLKNDWSNSTPVENDHPNEHNNVADAVTAMQVKVGIDNSTDTNSIDYRIKNAASIDPGHKHTTASINDFDLTGLSDGDFLAFESASSTFKRATSTTPNASDTLAGVSEIATQAEIDADTATGGTGAALAISPDNLATSKYSTRLPLSDEKAAMTNSVLPAAGNPFVTVSAQDAKFLEEFNTTQTAFENISAFAPVRIAEGESTIYTGAPDGTEIQVQQVGTSDNNDSRFIASVITGITGRFNAVKVRLSKNGTPTSPLVVEVRTDLVTPTTTLIGQIDESAVTTSQTDYTIILGGDYVANNETFYITYHRLDEGNPDNTNIWEVGSTGVGGGSGSNYRFGNSNADLANNSVGNPTALQNDLIFADATAGQITNTGYNNITTGYVGFATSAITAAASGSIKVAGQLDGFTGLTQGSVYYLDPTGGLTTSTQAVQAGVALSATKMLIK